MRSAASPLWTVSGHVPFDEGLPQLDMLLRPDEMSSVLGQGEWRISYLRYKPGTNCIVLYQRVDGENRQWTYCKAFHDDRPARPSDRRRLNEYRPDLNLAVVRFPRDLQLPSLSRAFDPGDQEDLLKRWVYRERRDEFRRSWGRWQPVRYKPERRCLLKGQFEDGSDHRPREFYARFYRQRDIDASLGRYRFLGALEGGVRIPRLVGTSRKHQLLLTEAVPGRPLAETLRHPSGDTSQRLRSTAAALSRWHRQEIPRGLSACTPAPPRIFEQTRMLSRLLPNSITAQETSGMLARAAQRLSVVEKCLLHGDFYYDQVLVDDDLSVSFVDLDELCCGDAEADVANFCAHLRVGAMLGTLDRALAGLWEECFLEEYQSHSDRPLRRRRLNWRLAESLMLLATHPFRVFRPDWPDRVEDILEEAREIAACLS